MTKKELRENDTQFAAEVTAEQGHHRMPILASQIKEAHQSTKAAQEKSLAHILQAGRLLREAMDIVSQDDREAWLYENCQITVNEAWSYMMAVVAESVLSEDPRYKGPNL